MIRFCLSIDENGKVSESANPNGSILTLPVCNLDRNVLA